MASAIRNELKELGTQTRFRFSGKFVKYGFKYKDYRKTHAAPTILLQEITLLKDTDKILITDHLWFNLTKGFKKLGILQKNELVSFNGRITKYTKGYQGYRDDIKKPIIIDYGIERPTKITLDQAIDSTIVREQWNKKDWEICNDIYDMYAHSYESRNIVRPYLSY